MNPVRSDLPYRPKSDSDTDTWEMISTDLDLPNDDMEPEIDEKQQVATITTDEYQPMEEDKPLATDDAAIVAKFLPYNPDLEVLDEQKQVYTVESWKSLERKDYGPRFTAGGAPWRLLMFPFGNNNNTDACSLYLEHSFPEKPPEDWYACVEFLFVMSNPNDPSLYVTNSAHHRFNVDATDWGFTRFVDLRKMQMPWESSARPLLENDSVTITTHIRVIKDPTGVLWHSFENYDSKKETGMVGLKNQGATCYLNSLLQSLYLTNAFRKAIYQIPTEEETNARNNSAYALQRLFYYLQKSPDAVSTLELTQSFGWDTRQIFEQQDVQELSRILMDRMEARMKGTSSEKALEDLFVGSTRTFLECIHVDFVSSRSDVFWDIQLNVKNNKNLDESFKDCIREETMEGENKYFAEGFGLQDAKKGDIFERFPSVLHLQLKRFEYSWETETTTKINDRFEFPETFDASPYLAKDADFSEPWIYKLHGVLVHSGDLNAGHYYAFLKPAKDGAFYKFDDDRVTRATLKEAIDENFGGEFPSQPNGVNGQQRNPFTFKFTKHRFMSAYMLVYIRESRLDQVLHPIGDDDVPAHLDQKIKEEQLEYERRRKEKEEAYLYAQVPVGTTANFNAFQGFDVFPPTTATEADPAAIPKVWKLLKTTKTSDFNKMMAKEYGVDEDLVRPWACVGRQNHTTRPDAPISWPNLTLEECGQKLGTKPPLKLWLEIAQRNPVTGGPDWPEAEQVTNTKDPSQPILLFLKYFDIDRQCLMGQGTVYIEKSKRISELQPIILQRMGWPAGTNLRLLEEIKASMIDTMKLNNTFAISELQNGDIVCFQKAVTEEESRQLAEAGKISDATRFYDYLLNRVTITLVDRHDLDNKETQFEVDLSRKSTYDQIAAKVGERLNVDPTHLRFSTVALATNRPRPPLKRNANAVLTTMLNSSPGMYGSTAAVRTDVLLYEVLELSLGELETKRSIKMTLLSDGMTKEEVFDVLVSKNGTVRDLIAPLKKKAELSDDDEQYIRFYEVRGGQVYRELEEASAIQAVQEFHQIYAERTPQEEIEAVAGSDRAIYAYHFDKEPSKTHGVPFKFIVKPGEIFSATKERLSKRTGIKGKQFEKIKFYLVPRSAYQKTFLLEDEHILGDLITTSEDQLGLDHINKSRNILNRGDAMMIR